MKKKLTLWIMALPLFLLAQESGQGTGTGALAQVSAYPSQTAYLSADSIKPKPKPKKIKIPYDPDRKYPPVPDEVKPDFSKEAIFKALFVAGLNLSQIEGCGEATYRKVGAIVGGGTVIKFSKRFSVSAELLYSQKGARPQFATEQYSGQKDKFDITSDYVDLPVTFSVHDKKTLMFGAGLQLSVLARYQQTDTAGNIVTSSPPPNGEQPHRVDLLGQVCGTFFIKQRIGIGMRFAYSLLKIRDAVAGSNFKGEYNNTLSIRISYLLDPKHAKWNK